MSKLNVILDPHWRGMSELFSDADRARLDSVASLVWGRDASIPKDVYDDALKDTEVLIACDPVVDAATLEAAPNLRMVIEVSGAFPDTVDYAACADRGIEVLSCAPGFRQSVAEMGLAMALSGARGLIDEHEAFRSGQEGWLQDRPERDFTLYGASVGFVGFGQIAQELTRLLVPFAPTIQAYDPWLPEHVAAEYGATLKPLDDVLRSSKCLFVTAIPTAENRGLLNTDRLSLMQDGALLILLSRAHLVDFDALRNAVQSGRLRAAIDVFPQEPVPADDPIRTIDGATLSPHRAAAVSGGRQLIGQMICDDLEALRDGRPDRRLAVADRKRINLLAGADDSAAVGDMAKDRKS